MVFAKYSMQMLLVSLVLRHLQLDERKNKQIKSLVTCGSYFNISTTTKRCCYIFECISSIEIWNAQSSLHSDYWLKSFRNPSWGAAMAMAAVADASHIIPNFVVIFWSIYSTRVFISICFGFSMCWITEILFIVCFTLCRSNNDTLLSLNNKHKHKHGGRESQTKVAIFLLIIIHTVLCDGNNKHKAKHLRT